jgi:acyl-CoA thioester hydrolase
MAELRPFARKFIAGWGDMDFNAHMRNTAFLDRSADVRMMFFAERGFPMSEFARLRIGPVVLQDVVDYRREVGLLEEIEVTVALAGLAPDGSRFAIRNEIRRSEGKLCATVSSSCGWLDLAARKLVVPPAPLLDVLRALPRSNDFASLPSGREK